MKTIELREAKRYGVAGYSFVHGVSQPVEVGVANALLAIRVMRGGREVPLFVEAAVTEAERDSAPPAATGSRKAERDTQVVTEL